MTAEEIFAERTRSFGGRFDWRTLTPGNATSYFLMNQYANELIASARESCPSLPAIHFDFLLNPSVNACVFKEDGQYFIAMNTGTRYMLELIFSRMLCDRRLFDFINTGEGEDYIGAEFKYTTNAEEMYQAGITPIFPKSRERFGYFAQLLHRASVFIIGHEIAHITLGHLDYILSKSPNGMISEIGWSAPSAIDNFERQVIEIHADARSTRSAM